MKTRIVARLLIGIALATTVGLIAYVMWELGTQHAGK